MARRALEASRREGVVYSAASLIQLLFRAIDLRAGAFFTGFFVCLTRRRWTANDGAAPEGGARNQPAVERRPRGQFDPKTGARPRIFPGRRGP